MREVDTTVIGKCAAENGEVVDAVLGITLALAVVDSRQVSR